MLALQKLLQDKVKEAGVEALAKEQLLKANFVSESKPGWTKICNWKKLNKEEQTNLKEYFIARDKVARQYNLPAHFILAKEKVVALGKNCPKTQGELFRIVGFINRRYEQSLKTELIAAFNRVND